MTSRDDIPRLDPSLSMFEKAQPAAEAPERDQKPESDIDRICELLATIVDRLESLSEDVRGIRPR